MNTTLQTAFDREFNLITDELMDMGRQVVSAIELSMTSLNEANAKLAKKIVEEDQKINDLRFKIEEDCVALIATQQPAARDLRAVIAAMHIVVELERIGDHVKGIAKTVLLMKHEPLLKTLKKIFKMGELSQKMLSQALEAFIKRDSQWANEIAAMDPEMDALYKAVFDKLIEVMAEEPDLVVRGTYLLWTAHNLERIADRVTNIAEHIIFMTTGDLRELKY